MSFESDTPTTPITPVSNDTWNMDPAQSTSPIPAAPSGAPQDEGHAYSTKVRFTTITWGLIMLGVGVGIITLAAGYTFDLQLALIGVLAVSGVTLLGGSLVRAIRK